MFEMPSKVIFKKYWCLLKHIDIYFFLNEVNDLNLAGPTYIRSQQTYRGDVSGCWFLFLEATEKRGRSTEQATQKYLWCLDMWGLPDKPISNWTFDPVSSLFYASFSLWRLSLLNPLYMSSFIQPLQGRNFCLFHIPVPRPVPGMLQDLSSYLWEEGRKEIHTKILWKIFTYILYLNMSL